MLLELSLFLREDVGIRHDVEVRPAKLFLHLNHVETQSVFPSNFVTLRKVIDSLILIQAFV